MFAAYRIDGLLGRGGMGVVYLATHRRLGRQAALKVLVSDLVDVESFRERFLLESQLAASLDHPNVIPIYDAEQFDGVPYIAMRYVEGASLQAMIGKRGVSPERLLPVVEQVAGALDAAHGAGLVHRDVKPDNILIEESSGRVYLSDFGLAKQTESAGLTRTGLFLGTAAYCAPEQIEGKALDARADVYALGCVVFHCLAARPPYQKETEAAVILAHLTEPPPALSTLQPGLPSHLDGVLATAMAKQPEDRYPTAGAFAAAYRAALDPVADNGLRAADQGAGRGPLAETVPATTIVVPTPPPDEPLAPTVPAGRDEDAPGVGRKGRLLGRRKWVIGVAAVAALAVGGAVAALLATSGSDSTSSIAFNKQVAGIVNRVIPSQRRVNAAVSALKRDSASLASLRSKAASLERAILRAEGAASAISPADAGERSTQTTLSEALSKHASYAEAVIAVPAVSSLSSNLAKQLVAEAGSVDSAYASLDAKAAAPCCPVMPPGKPPAGRFLALANLNARASPLGDFVSGIENMLAQSAASRREVSAAISGAVSCSIAARDAGRRLESSASIRQIILGQLASLKPPTARAASSARFLQQALTKSIEANRRWRDWLFSLADQGLTSCPLKQTQELILAQQSDRQATAAKERFVAAFNPLANKLKSRTWRAGDI
jgi:serine/threonine-protein kinase